MDTPEKYPIYHLEFPNQYLMTSTFIRFQEHYESPEFRGKIFTLEEYMDWYASRKGKFSYFEDWWGFNIPSSVLVPFYGGRFDPLTKKESALLNFFKDTRGDFYIIGTIAGPDYAIFHEIVHGLFFLFPDYRREVVECIGRFDTGQFRKYLLGKDGYNDTVLDDEINAFVTEGLEEKRMVHMDKFVHDRLHSELMAIFRNHIGIWPEGSRPSRLKSLIHCVSWQEIAAPYQKRLAG